MVTGVPPLAWASAASRCPRRPRESAVPAIAAIRSIQTAVEVLATLAIWAPSVPPLAAAAADTSPDQSGFTYPLAPAYGLSTWVPGCVGVVVVGPPGVPSQGAPLSENGVGMSFVPEYEPLKPKFAVAFEPSVPPHDGFF